MYRPRRISLAAATLTAALLLVAGCGTDDDEASADQPELVVFAAASLTAAFEEYGDRFSGADVQFSFAGSDDLAAQIRQGVTPDVYAAANTSLPDELADEGLLEKPETFVTNELVIGVPAGSDIDDYSDLEQPGATVAVGDPAVPVGAYTREVLEALGPEAADAITANVASEEPDASGITAKVSQGAVDAGFIYRSDVAAAAGAIDAIPLPRSVSPDVAYAIATGADATQPRLAAAFIAGLLGTAGQRILREAGFGPAPGRP